MAENSRINDEGANEIHEHTTNDNRQTLPCGLRAILPRLRLRAQLISRSRLIPHSGNRAITTQRHPTNTKLGRFGVLTPIVIGQQRQIFFLYQGELRMPLPAQNRTTEIEVLLNHIPLLVRERFLALKTLAHFLVFVVFPKERIAICIHRHLLILLHVLGEKTHLPFAVDFLKANERELRVEKHIKLIHTNAKNAGEGEMAELMNHHKQRQTQNQLKYSNQYRHIVLFYEWQNATFASSLFV